MQDDVSKKKELTENTVVYLVEICGLGVHLIHRNTRCSTHSPAKCRRKGRNLRGWIG
jgi:hypothetical protein